MLLIAHGSRQQAANDDLHELVARIAAKGTHPIVEGCFLELAEPDVPTSGERCIARGATRVLMVPYFLSAGVHLQRDLTSGARRSSACRYPDKVEFRLGPPLGPHPLLDDLVAARIQELDPGGPPARRGSRLLNKLGFSRHDVDKWRLPARDEDGKEKKPTGRGHPGRPEQHDRPRARVRMNRFDVDGADVDPVGAAYDEQSTE